MEPVFFDVQKLEEDYNYGNKLIKWFDSFF